jgi:serine/threonine protein kinase
MAESPNTPRWKRLKGKIEELDENPNALENDPLFVSLGKGGCSMGVFPASRSRPNSGEIVVKVVKTDRDTEILRREVNLTRKLSHQNIRKGLKFTEGKTYAYARMEPAPGKDMLQMILAHRYPERRDIPDISPDFPAFDGIRLVLREIAKGLVYLHKKGLVHGDIKPENIVINADNFAMIRAPVGVKIIDFGLAFKAADIEEAKRSRGDPNWTSPETYLEDVAKTDRKDIFSFGTLVYTAFCGGFMIPWETHCGNVLEFRDFLGQCHKRMMRAQQSMWAFPAIRDLIIACTNFSPELRPSAGSLLETHFFTKSILSRCPLTAESEESN